MHTRDQQIVNTYVALLRGQDMPEGTPGDVGEHIESEIAYAKLHDYIIDLPHDWPDAPETEQ